MRKHIILLLLALASLPGLRAAELSDSLLRRYAAEMLMIGFRGDSVETDPDISRYIRDIRPGGIILFDIDLTCGGGLGSRNIKSAPQVAHLTEQIQALADYPVLIAVDQEGGLVQRLKPRYGYKALPRALTLGTAINNPDTTALYAAVMADELSHAGVNMNLAPELDIHRADCPVIGRLERAYSANADSVAFHASITCRHMLQKGIIPVGKHFPGHGSATADSHYGLTDVTATWDSTELIPFARLIGAGELPAIMTAHIFNRNIDPDYPATLSHKTITGLLRDKMGFDGLVITDDMYMKGIIDNYSIEEAVVDAINAGADMMIMGNNISTGYEADRPYKIVDIIVDAVRSGRIPRQRLIDSHRRIERIQKIMNPND